MQFDAPYLYAGGVRCFVAADLVATWLQRGHRDTWWRWRIAEDRRDYRPVAEVIRQGIADAKPKEGL
jgi:hypothetical protein